MNNKTQTFGLIFFSCLFISSICLAQETPPPDTDGSRSKNAPDHAAMMQKIDKDIGLSPEQKSKMNALREAFESQQKTVRAELSKKKTALKTILDNDKPDRHQADALITDILTLQGSLMRSHIDHLFNIRAILSPEQFKKLEAFRQKHHHKPLPKNHKT